MNDFINYVFGWWNGSALQIGIVVALFWAGLVAAICAIAGANSIGGRQ